MAAWNAVITNGGKNLLASWIDGTTLRFDKAACGTGTAPLAALIAQTALVSQKQVVSLVGSEKTADGIKLKVQIVAPSVGYNLNQIGIWCKIGNGAPVMVAIFQRDDAVSIPSKTETPDFIYNFFGTLAVSNAGAFTVNIDTSAVVSRDEFATAIDAIAAGKADLDPETHKVKAEQLPTMNYETPLKDALSKAYPVDNDGVIIVDNADDKTKRILWSSIKTTLRTIFDTLYAGIGHSHTAAQVGARPSTWTPTAADVGAAPYQLIQGGNFNNVVTPGLYTMKSASANAPSSGTYFGLLVTKSDTGSYVQQIAFMEGAPRAFIRYLNSTTWSAWKEFSMADHKHAPSDLTSAVPINLGGTGATTAAEARTALAALTTFAPTNITISATWSGTGPYTQSIAVSGVLASMDWRLGLHLAKITDDAARKLQEKAFGCITWVETYNGGITLTCRDKKPDVAISAVLAGEV